MKTSFLKIPNTLQNIARNSIRINSFLIDYEQILEEFAINLNWFIDPNMKIKEIKKLVLLKYSNDEKEIDSLMMKYFDNYLNDIQTRINQNFPNRIELFNDIFAAHKQGLYSLSITSSFSQIDGIVFEKCNQCNYFHQIKKLENHLKNTKLKNKEETLLNKSYELLLNNKLPIKLTKNGRGEDFTKLNRHQVIHGEVLNFNTKLNSLKSISFLVFISYLFSR